MYPVHAETVYTTRGPEVTGDQRYIYQNKLLELALKKTVSSHGPYELRITQTGSNTKRAMYDVLQGNYPNFFVQNAVTPDRLKNMVAVPFPLTLGVLGYRMAFVSKETKEQLRTVKNLDSLKEYKILQGLGWIDNHILRDAGFGVITSSSYPGMFRMVANKRADLFLRGVNEVLPEWQRHKDVANLAYDDTMLIYYDFPAFFFTSKGNEAAANRILVGLKKAYLDGSLQEIWADEYRESIEFATRQPRRIYTIPNPLNVYPDKSYQDYMISADIFGDAE